MASRTIELIKTSDKVLFALSKRPKDQGKKWLAQELNISRPTLDAKLSSNCFSVGEIARMASLGLL